MTNQTIAGFIEKHRNATFFSAAMIHELEALRDKYEGMGRTEDKQ